MLTRLRLLKGAAALLYIGPLFAGLTGMGWGAVAPFAGIFIVWLMVLRPEQWPATPDEWLGASAWLAALTQVLSQLLLVCVLLGIGRGLGAVAGFLPAVNPLFPLAISFLAIPICRMLWDASEAADMGIYLDDEAEAAQIPRVAAQAAAAIVPLLNFSDDAPDALVAASVNETMQSLGADVRLKALIAALSHPDRSHAALRRAVVLWATGPEIVAPGRIPNLMAGAFAIAGSNADLLRLYVPRGLALIGAFANRAASFPEPDELRKVAGQLLEAGAQMDLPLHLRTDLHDGLLALSVAVEKALTPVMPPAEPMPEPKLV
jgi:hypothetical protein